ncbi:MAG TPA: hypothetical protein VHB21_13545, partial [Minicystis sp.]|nr:hypothetical protein [Minicystis sp.]
ELVATKGRVLVTIRQVGDGGGALVSLKRGPGLALVEAGRVNLPADAWGLAVTPDEATALVTSAWTHTVSAVDLATMKVRWSVDVAREPRGVVVLPGGDRAYVSHLVGSDVTRIDGVRGAEPKVTKVELPAAPLLSPAGVKLPASLGYAAVASLDGERVYFPRHALGAMGADAWFGAGTVDVLVTSTDAALAPARAAHPATSMVGVVHDRVQQDANFRASLGVPTMMESWRDPSPIDAPRAVVYRTRTNTLLVANEGTDSVVELDARALAPTLVATRKYVTSAKEDKATGVPERGGAPSGIALSADEAQAYVFCRTTDDLVVLELPPDAGAYKTAPPISIPLGAGEDEDKELRVGRYLFHTAKNRAVSGGLACAGCHPEGRDDGHVWREAHVTLKDSPFGGGDQSFTNFFGGPDVSAIAARWGTITAEGEHGFGYARQTPMLAGRVDAPGPYGWHGESPDLLARIVAGFDLHRWRVDDTKPAAQRLIAAPIAKFLRHGLVPPPRLTRALTDEEQRGREVFMSPATGCATCHVPATGYTDRSVVQLPELRPPTGFAEDPNKLYKVPSLVGVGGTAPYMHDGRFSSLETLLEYNQDRMGKTSQLSAEERKALVAFLRTL